MQTQRQKTNERDRLRDSDRHTDRKADGYTRIHLVRQTGRDTQTDRQRNRKTDTDRT